jgi:translation elongation factor aEF-1 beta
MYNLKMAIMILTYRVMPEDGEVEYSQLENVTKKTIENFDDSVKINSIEDHDVGFGLKAVKVNFSIDEKCGSEAVEEKLKEQEEIGDVIIESMSRAMG